MKPFSNKFKFFGIALDASDDPKKVVIKQNNALGSLPWKVIHPNPYRGLTAHLHDIFNLKIYEKAGELAVDSWLTPTPSVQDLPLVDSENYNTFLANDSCRDYASLVERFVYKKILPNKPAMIAVDHSMTGGVLKALKHHINSDELSVLVFDNHFDGISSKDRIELLRYAKEHRSEMLNFQMEFSEIPLDVPETYNCATFLKYLLDEQVFSPRKLMVIGVGDYPPKESKRKQHLKNYSDAYLQYENKGVTFIPKHDIDVKGRNISKRIDSFFSEVDTPYIYISFDADIGSYKSVYSARTMNGIGLSRVQICGLATEIVEKIEQYNKMLIGFDVCEVDTYFTGYDFKDGVKDTTYEVLSDFVRIILKHSR